MDYRVSKNKLAIVYSLNEVDTNQQLTMYQLAAKRNGFADKEILLKFDTLIKTQKPKFEQYYTSRSDIDEKRLVRSTRSGRESSEVFSSQMTNHGAVRTARTGRHAMNGFCKKVEKYDKKIINRVQDFLTAVGEDRVYQIVNVELLLKRHPPEAVIDFLTLLREDYKKELARLLKDNRTDPRINDLVAKNFRIKMDINTIKNPLATIDSFNRQFQLGDKEREAVAWGWTKEAGETMFAVVNTYTRASQYEGLPAESSWKLQRVGGNVLGMLT